MEILKVLQKKLDLNENDLPEFEEVLQEVKGITEKYHIQFSENAELVFYAHIISLILRLKSKEVLNGKFDDCQKEIESSVISIAEKIVTYICKRYNSEMDKAEVLLIAIHIQAALLNRE